LENEEPILVNTDGTLSKDDWENEIHLSRGRIKKLRPKFEPLL
jgi:hypothetical protein